MTGPTVGTTGGGIQGGMYTGIHLPGYIGEAYIPGCTPPGHGREAYIPPLCAEASRAPKGRGEYSLRRDLPGS